MLSWQGCGRAPGRGEDHHHTPDGGQEHLRGERGDGARQQNCQVRGGALISSSFCKLLFPCHHYCHYWHVFVFIAKCQNIFIVHLRFQWIEYNKKQLFWVSSQRRGLTRTRGILAWCLMIWKFLSKWVWIFLFHSPGPPAAMFPTLW